MKLVLKIQHLVGANLIKCKMRKWKILILMFLVTVCLVQSAEICEDILNPGETCTMLTPYISCSNYTYQIYNTTQSVENGSLTQLDGNIYYFTFNQSDGDYLVELCDGSTREIIVEGKSKMIYFSVILVFMFLTVLAIYGFMRSEEAWLKTCMAIIMSILITSLLRFTSWFVTINHSGETALIDTLDKFYMFSVWSMRSTFLFGMFVVLIYIINSLRMRKKKKQFDIDKWE